MNPPHSTGRRTHAGTNPLKGHFEAFEPADTSRKGLRGRRRGVLEKSNTWPEQVLETLNSCWGALLESCSNTQANVRRDPLAAGEHDAAAYRAGMGSGSAPAAHAAANTARAAARRIPVRRAGLARLAAAARAGCEASLKAKGRFVLGLF